MTTDSSDTIFTAAFDREARISPDGRRVTHRAMSWSMDYTPASLLTWIAFYERIAAESATPQFHADLEVLHAARDFLARQQAQA